MKYLAMKWVNKYIIQNSTEKYITLTDTFKADLDGTTFAYDCRMRFLERALLVSCRKSHTTLVIQHCLYVPTIDVEF